MGILDQQLQQKIDHEIRMRDGTAKLLAASKHPEQMLEAAKNLHTSNARMLTYMAELQKRKTDEVLKRQSSDDGNQVACQAKISVSDIRIPLMWRDADHFKSKGDHRRYAVFCLVKIGSDIYDTQLLKSVDRTMTDLSFDDTIIFNDVSPDFECRLEVYCHRCQDDLSVASTPKRIRKKIEDFGTSVGRTVGRRLSGLKDDSDPMTSMIIGPKFELIGSGTLKLSDVTESMCTFNLNVETEASGIELPLFGNFCCRLAAQPYCLVQDTIVGQLFLQDPESLTWKLFWCRLCNLSISCWERDDEMNSLPPLMKIPVTKMTQVSEVPASLCLKDHCIQITSKTSGGRKASYNLATSDQHHKQKWWDAIYQHLLDQVMWLQACETIMPIKTATPKRHSIYRKHISSLYDTTPVVEETASPMTRMLNRLDIPEQASKALQDDSKDTESQAEGATEITEDSAGSLITEYPASSQPTRDPERQLRDTTSDDNKGLVAASETEKSASNKTDTDTNNVKETQSSSQPNDLHGTKDCEVSSGRSVDICSHREAASVGQSNLLHESIIEISTLTESPSARKYKGSQADDQEKDPEPTKDVDVVKRLAFPDNIPEDLHQGSDVCENNSTEHNKLNRETGEESTDHSSEESLCESTPCDEVSEAGPKVHSEPQETKISLGGESLQSEDPEPMSVGTTDEGGPVISENQATEATKSAESSLVEESKQPPETEQPELKETEQPAADETEKPELKETEQLEMKETEQPEVKQTEQPEVKETEQPEVKETEQPEVKETEQPEVKETEQLEVKETEQPEVKETEQPEVKDTEQPEVEETEQPEVDETPQPQVKETEQPEVKETQQPEVKETPQLEVKETEQPEVTDTPQSEVKETPQPEVQQVKHEMEPSETQETEQSAIQEKESPILQESPLPVEAADETDQSEVRDNIPLQVVGKEKHSEDTHKQQTKLSEVPDNVQSQVEQTCLASETSCDEPAAKKNICSDENQSHSIEDSGDSRDDLVNTEKDSSKNTTGESDKVVSEMLSSDEQEGDLQSAESDCEGQKDSDSQSYGSAKQDVTDQQASDSTGEMSSDEHDETSVKKERVPSLSRETSV